LLSVLNAEYLAEKQHIPISYADVVKNVNVEEPTNGFPAASSTSFNNMKHFNSAVHTTSNSMKENHKSVAILAPTLSSSNISINETNFNVFPVPGDELCFFHSLSFILNRDCSMSNNYRQLICTLFYKIWLLGKTEISFLMNIT
jgi:hypothetical protein